MKKTIKLFIVNSLLFVSPTFSKDLDTKGFFGMTTGATVMPTVLPIYTTVYYRNHPSYDKYKNKEERFHFFDENFDVLNLEIAKGEGERLNTFASFYDLKDVDVWKSYLQSDFDKIISFKTHKESFDYIDSITNEKFGKKRIKQK